MKKANLLMGLLLIGVGLLTGCRPFGQETMSGIDGSGPGTDGSGNAVVIGSIGAGFPPSSATDILAFGSLERLSETKIRVAGVTINLAQSDIIMNGQWVDINVLQSGQQVLVTGSSSEDGTYILASSVIVNMTVVGPVDVVDWKNGRLTVLGQTVWVNGSMVFSETAATPGSIPSGTVIQVSGQLRADGSIAATHLQKLGESMDFTAGAGVCVVAGKVSALDFTQMLLRINGLVVDFSRANMQIELNENMAVRVQGNSFSESGVFLAETIEVISDITASSGAFIQLEGLVTDFISRAEFKVSGIPVAVHADTVFQDEPALDLKDNQTVVLNGVINDAGTVRADQLIVLEDAGFIYKEEN